MPAVQQVDYVACSAQRRKVKRLHVLKVDRDIGGGSMVSQDGGATEEIMDRRGRWVDK